MSQQEDDLRALAKIMDFLRAVSIILVVAQGNRIRNLMIVFGKVF